jgi:two-component system, sensor histidine kinase and response regulator
MQAEYKILAVDDEPANAIVLRELLDSTYTVATASSGEEALGLLPSFKPDLILLDIMMPGINGYETCRRIRKNSGHKFVKIIMLSGRSDLKQRLEGYSAGADDFIGKPFDLDELQQKVKIFLKLKRIEEVDTIQNGLLQYFSRETRTPLNNIVAPAESLLKNNSLDHEARQFAEIIAESSKWLLEFVRKVSLLCELKKGLRLDRKKGFLNFHLLMEIQQYNTKASRKAVNIVLKNDADVMAELDWKLFDKVIGFILENAIEHSPDNAPVEVRAEVVDGICRTTISDRGNGIDPKLMSGIFDSNADGGNRSFQEECKGFSLAIAKQVITLHGGTIRAHNNPDSGATFCIEIPSL